MVQRVTDVTRSPRPPAPISLAEEAVDADATVLAVADSFETFYHREYSRLVALAYALSGSRSHADDLAQEAMLAAYRSWSRVGGYDSPAAWVRRVCANLATSQLRRRGVEARALLRLRAVRAEPTELGSDGGTFWAAVRGLPRRQAQAVALYYVYGCSIADTATTLGCAEGTVKSHLARARQALAPVFTDQQESRPR
jgi:RNA polymerase sigma-70 factor (ECF subfamily)